ncbi:hypothetical protein LG277_03315 [Vreelandella aquamarina]|uniref:hypothetical protein n=1 Tax=Vreelandella aquamarina TaxID=77097 RepID=UPI00384F18BD
MQTNLVKQAHHAFKQDDYQSAKALYQKAASKYGQNLFDANIYLCEQRLRNQVKHDGATPKLSEAISASQQLEETQSLLEHYYRRCQELEYQLQDAG